jgi:uncharacterized membrane protein
MFLTFLTRWIHVAAMAVLLGGSLLMWVLSFRTRPDEANTRSLITLLVAEKYEVLFWIALGLLALTGVGNLGAYGRGLPAAASPWGVKLTWKLLAILLLLLFSLLRTLLVARLRPAGDSMQPASQQAMFRHFYALTTVFSLVILYLGLSLAHG